MKGDAFVAEKPTVWNPKLGAAAAGIAGLWDLAPDRKRVVVVTPAGSAEALTQEHHVVFLQSLFDERRRKVPPGK